MKSREPQIESSVELRPIGLTLAIITYNGASRINSTLSHIAAQNFAVDVEWEILIVDNNSSDNTLEVVEASLREFGLIERSRIVTESRQGAIFARTRALQEAQYSFLSFVDDDNWLAKNWICEVVNTFQINPEVAIICCPSIEAVQGEKPLYLDRVWGWLAVGSQCSRPGLVLEQPKSFWTAGCSFRLSAIDELFSLNLTNCLTGRCGNKRVGGEDHEICLMLSILGYDSYFLDTVSIQHAIPGSRISAESIERQIYLGGKSHPVLDVYRNYFWKKHFFSRWTRLGRNLFQLGIAAGKYFFKRLFFRLPELSYNRQTYLHALGRVAGFFSNYSLINQASRNVDLLTRHRSNRDKQKD